MYYLRMFFESYNLNKNVEECWPDLANGLPVSPDYLSPGHRLLPAVCSFPLPRSDRIFIGKLCIDNFWRLLLIYYFTVFMRKVLDTLLFRNAMLLRVTHPSDTIRNKSQEKLSETWSNKQRKSLSVCLERMFKTHLTRPGVQQCQAQGQVFSPWLGSI